ncbi:MAG: hypothetical protein HFE93_00495 [Acutalibacter muris]|nr:hypothetical protein [Acutalibacter muris]
MCKKFISLLLSLTILLGAVWVPAGAAPGDNVTLILFNTETNKQISTISAKEGGPYIIHMNNVASPSVTGYDFKGWSATQSGTTPIDMTASIPAGTNGYVFLYTIFTPKDITVTFNNGYGGTNSIIDTKTLAFNSSYSFPTTPSRPNYTFAGWYTAASGGTEVTGITPVTNASNHTIYAHWTRDTITVNLDYNGGKYSNADNAQVTVQSGDAYSTAISRYTPTLDGFTFDGWTMSKNTGNVIDLSTTIASAASPKTLYAKWTEAEYTVTLDPNGGDAITDNQFSIEHTGTYAEANKVTPTRTGYKFLGWYTARSDGTKIEDDSKYSDLKVTTLYAQWEAKSGIELTFDLNTPKDVTTPAPTPPAKTTVTYDQPYGKALPSPTPAPLKGDKYEYTFSGWYEEKEDAVKTQSSPDVEEKTYAPVKSTDLVKKATPFSLYARWGYNIEFFANNTDDVNTETAFATLKCVTGAPYGSLPTGRPSKPGYEFLGWYKGAEDGAYKFGPTASDIADGSIKKVYAHYEPNKYTVTLDANGGEFSGDDTKKSFEDVVYGKSYSDNNVDLSTKPTRYGYSCEGWVDEKGNDVQDSDIFLTNGPVVLYAKWKPQEITLKFDYNFPGGITQDTSTHPNISSTKAIYGQPYDTALPARNPSPVTSDEKVTYTFDGWYTTKEDKNADSSGNGAVTGKKVQSSLPVELEYSNNSATLFARWKYKVSFYANLNPEATSQSPISGVSLDAVAGSRYGQLPGQPGGNPSKHFQGWYTEPIGGTEIKDTAIADGETVKLYAHWGDTRVCAITLDGNGFTLPEGYPTFERIEYGQNYSKLLDNISDPVREGYTFLGWYLNAEGTGSAVTRNSIVNGDHTLYAKWRINTFKVTLNLNYGSSSSVKTVDYGTELSKVLTEPERTGYAFEGWFTDQKCENPVAPDTKVTSDVTLYAKWIEAKRVNLVVNGGTLPSGTPAYINVYENGQYNLPTPTWTGCTFQGWYTQENGGTKVSYGDKVPAVDSIPSTLYAQWIPMDVTVTFDPNGSPNHQASTRTYKVGSKYGIGLGALNWSGYKFMGWYTQPTGGEKIEATTVVTVKSSNDLTITLYAHWGYEVSFDPTDGSGSMDPQVAEMNQPYTLPVCTFEPPAGMRFGGWAAGTPEASTTYPGGSQYTVNRRVTFYATWTTAPIVITATCTSGGRLTTEDGKTNEVTVERGTDITFVAQANDGYELKELLVDGVNYNYTDVHTFRDVMEDHTIHAVFQRIGAPSYSTCDHGTSCPLNSYSDLNTSEWYHDAIHYCVDNVVMGGTGSSKFYPRRNTTRAELAVSLYNHQGRPPVAGSGLLPNTYSDVKAGEWHYQAIEWATKEGILAGYGNGKFRPNQSVTREQLVAIIWRHAGSPKPRSTTLRFYDAGSVSGYAWEAMCWATEQGILQGRSSGYLVPKGTATRAEVAQMLKNYLN